MVTIVVPYLIKDLYIPEWDPTSIVSFLAIPFFVFGLTIFISTLHLFHTQAKATLAPWSEKAKLVVSGPYRYVRNPMIASVLFILIAEAMFFSSIAIFIWAFLFFTVNTIYFIYKEEPELEERFGEDYTHYKSKVGRWIPTFKAYSA